MLKPENAHGKSFAGIVIHVTDRSCDQTIVSEILLGLEEEQVPYDLITGEHESDAADALDTAYQASLKSAFGVGICIAPARVVLHYSRLSVENPLLTIPAEAGNIKKYRTLGLNAARFIKGHPFDK